MRVILLKDIKNLGNKNDIKNVSDGYGRNFLLKQNLAKIATMQEINQIEKIKQEELSKKREEEIKEKETAKKISNLLVEIKVKTGEKDELFESITAKKIAEKIKKEGYSNINESNIELKDPLKSLGEHPVRIKFKQGLEVKIIIKIVKEK